MRSHPGGTEHTRRMIELSGLVPPAKVLDMGAGAGETMSLLRVMGYDAVGIDLEPRGVGVEQGDFLGTDYPDESFDGIISQCAFFISENVQGALREAYRLLKPDGVLMLSDVWFSDSAEQVKGVGFAVVHSEDMTPQWREYYIEAIWWGDTSCCEFKGKCTYELLICRKE